MYDEDMHATYFLIRYHELKQYLVLFSELSWRETQRALYAMQSRTLST